MKWLKYLYRRLRSLDHLEVARRQIDEARRHQRIALLMATEAQQQTAATREQLVACRGLLAVVMRQRDDYEKAVEVLARKLADLKEQRRRERKYLRYWLTRTVRPHEERSWN